MDTTDPAIGLRADPGVPRLVAARIADDLAEQVSEAVAVVDDSYLRSEVIHPVGLRDYLGLAWLSASMGTIAGALGSNFDSRESVREATYSQRYHERRKLFDSYQEQPEQA